MYIDFTTLQSTYENNTIPKEGRKRIQDMMNLLFKTECTTCYIGIESYFKESLILIYK